MTQDIDTTEPTKAELQQRISELETTVDQLQTEIESQSASLTPTRRRLIGGGVAGLLGLGAGVGVNTVSAGSSQVGTIGDRANNELVDIEAEDAQIDKLQLTELTSNPSSLSTGQIWYRTDLD
jgi:hypothetical protein